MFSMSPFWENIFAVEIYSVNETSNLNTPYRAYSLKLQRISLFVIML